MKILFSCLILDLNYLIFTKLRTFNLINILLFRNSNATWIPFNYVSFI